MKLLVITAAFPPMQAGEADHMLHLCRRLADRGLEIHVVTTQTNQVDCDLPFKVYPVIRDWSWFDLPRLKGLLHRIAPDVVLLKYIGWIYGNHPMITYAPTLVKKTYAPVLFVTQFANAQGAEPQTMPAISRLLRKGVARWAGTKDLDYNYGTLLRDSDRLIVYSDIHKEQLARRSSRVLDKAFLIPPPPLLQMSPEDDGSSRQKGRMKLGVERDEFLLTYFGYVYPYKGVETLIRAFQIVVSKHPRARLLILGGFVARESSEHPRFREEIVALPKQLGIDHRVIWYGGYAWDSDEASILLRAADAAILPLDYGVQMNNSSFAAVVAHGLPVISTRGSVLEAPFVNEKNVLLCTPKDPEAMAKVIEQLIGSPELSQRLKAGAAEIADNWFSWERAVDRTVEVLTSRV